MQCGCRRLQTSAYAAILVAGTTKSNTFRRARAVRPPRPSFRPMKYPNEDADLLAEHPTSVVPGRGLLTEDQTTARLITFRWPVFNGVLEPRPRV